MALILRTQKFLAQPKYAAPVDSQGLGKGAQLIFNPVIGSQDQVTGRVWTPGGNAKVDASRHGKAFQFDGVDDFYTYTGYQEITGAAGTFFMWCPLVGPPDTFGAVFFSTSGTYLWIDNTGRVYAWNSLANGSYTTFFNATNRSLVFSSNGTPSGTRLFIDGRHIDAVTFSGALTGFAAGSKSLKFGAYATGNSYDLNAHVLIAGYSSTTWGDAEARAFHNSKGQELFKAPPRRIWLPAAAGSEHNLSIGNAAQGNTASTGAIGQTQELAGGAATQTNSAQADAVAQTHTLLIANSAQGNSASTGEISQGDPLTAANLAQGNTAQAVGITQTHAISGENLAQAQTVDTGAVAQTHDLAGANAAQGNAASDGAVSQEVEHNLTISASIQANSADGASVEQTHVLVITASTQDNTGQSVSITQIHPLTAGNLSQANLLDNASLSNDLLIDSPVQQNAFSSGNVTVPQYLSAGSWEQGNFVSSGALRADIIFESALLTGQPRTVRVKKPGIPTDAPEWLRTMLETLTGRRNNKIDVPKEPDLTFSATPTKDECEKLFMYTNSVRSTLEKLINRMDT